MKYDNAEEIRLKNNEKVLTDTLLAFNTLTSNDVEIEILLYDPKDKVYKDIDSNNMTFNLKYNEYLKSITGTISPNK